MNKIIIILITTLFINITYSQETDKEIALNQFCSKVDFYFEKYNWGKSECLKYNFDHQLTSQKNDPLIYTTYGNKKSKNKYLIMCGVHGDEITPIKFCFDILKNINKDLKDIFIVVAPIVNPDSFLKTKPTRTNNNGVDVNRNFPTKNWDKLALKKWKHRYRSDKRRYPGQESNSEPETKFQIQLLKSFSPTYIISVHAPLTLLDYDGPAYAHNGEVHSAKNFLKEMSKKLMTIELKIIQFFQVA
jgi:protein MpaA